ncbi:hypothetical protein KUV50_03005 [Membranicola marinus]|uniref:Uncharacterized protein n=1 Tax=Membranihabitans marinus TaxID=1227546 RepID=A0A953LBV7_9BACT|nr:hypothetical protein [Membranihabitans marinus]MBY5957089.1 hypothetical protein [Membranihabitans marinus]
MTRNDMDTLVQKYINAESTRQEEEQLKTALRGQDVPADLKYLSTLFDYYELQKEHTVVPDFQNPAAPSKQPNARIISMRWMAVAASVAILVVTLLFFNQSPVTAPADTYDDPEIAAQNAAQALELLSGELNRGRTLALDQMKEFDNFNKYLNVF